MGTIKSWDMYQCGGPKSLRSRAVRSAFHFEKIGRVLLPRRFARSPRRSLFRKCEQAMPSRYRRQLQSRRSRHVLWQEGQKGGRIGTSAQRELYLTDSPVVRPTATLSIRGGVDYDGGAGDLTLPDTGTASCRCSDRWRISTPMPVSTTRAGRYTMTERKGTRYGSLVIRILANPQDQEDMKQIHALQDAITVEQKSSGNYDAQISTRSARRRL